LLRGHGATRLYPVCSFPAMYDGGRMTQARMQGWLTTKRTFLAVVFLGILALSARGVSDPDVWWHLKTGQLIAQTRTVPHADSFSFTRAGYPWVAHEWLTELFIYGVYRISGWGGLIVVFALMVSAAFFPGLPALCPGSLFFRRDGASRRVGYSAGLGSAPASGFPASYQFVVLNS
jgi:hypothetical protein